MSPHTSWITKTELQGSINVTLQKLEEKYHLIDKLLTEELYPLSKDTYHFAIQVLKAESREEHALLSHILNIAYKAELLSHGGGHMAILITVGYMKYLAQQGLLSNRSFWNDLEKELPKLNTLINSLSQTVCRPGMEPYLIQGIEQICEENAIVKEVALRALMLAGVEGRIFVENGRSPKFLIEQKNGYAFRCKPFPFFISGKRWQASNCKIMIVDGFVEKVSEIDGILHGCFHTKQPMILVATGFSEEVVATLRANQERGNFECLPVRVMPDVESLNMVNDIAIVSGTTPISSLKGELLCFVKHEELPSVESVELTHGEMVIHNSATAVAVGGQIRSLMEKKNDNVLIEDMQDILNKRIRSLIPNSVVIHLPESSRMNTDSYRVLLDNAFRYSKTVLNYGIIETQEFLEGLEKALQKETSPQAKALGYAVRYALGERQWFPTLTILGSTQLSLSLINTLFSSSGMVRLVSDQYS